MAQICVLVYVWVRSHVCTYMRACTQKRVHEMRSPRYRGQALPRRLPLPTLLSAHTVLYDLDFSKNADYFKNQIIHYTTKKYKY